MAMALGYFDGIHLGHRKVINKAKEVAEKNGWKSAVMTFDPHPSVVLSQHHKEIELITPLDEKKEIVKNMGIDYFVVVRFTSDFASLEPQEFVNQYIAGLNVHHVVAGFDFTYGRFGKGTMETLPIFADGRFTYTTIEKLTDSSLQEKVSSTMIRKLLQEGETEAAALQLGRHYQTKGIVIHGEKRGRQIGFPTANIQHEDHYLIPKTGVYTVRICIGGHWFNGVCNVGYKPTFKNPEEYSQTVEVYIINFDRSIYGEEVAIEWHHRIRDEKKFNGIEELTAQISKDKQTAIDYFKKIQE
jgi:riboflavin kinase/FMN adenylyltransferase